MAEDDEVRAARLDNVGVHRAGKRGGQHFAGKSTGKPWLDMKKAQKAQKRAQRNR